MSAENARGSGGRALARKTARSRRGQTLFNCCDDLAPRFSATRGNEPRPSEFPMTQLATGMCPLPGRVHGHLQARTRERMAKNARALPTILMALAAASTETVARRWWMMASGGCSPEEYQRMAAEKVKAALQSSAILFSSNSSLPRLLQPWYLGARRNAARLRRARRATKR